MRSMMRCLCDTQVEGRFFPQGSKGVGLLHEQIRWAVDADDVQSAIGNTAPECEIVELDLVQTWT